MAVESGLTVVIGRTGSELKTVPENSLVQQTILTVYFGGIHRTRGKVIYEQHFQEHDFRLDGRRRVGWRRGDP